jgi:hypothetical protein
MEMGGPGAIHSNAMAMLSFCPGALPGELGRADEVQRIAFLRSRFA